MLTIPWAQAKGHPQAGTVVQVSRLELARTRDVPGFLVAALRIRRLALRAPGASGLSLRAQPMQRTFWTLSAWQNEAAISDFMRSEGHRAVMVKYRGRMETAHFHTWSTIEESVDQPSWTDAIRHYETANQQ